VRKPRSYDSIQIVVRESQARQLLQIQKILKSRKFTVTVAHRPEGVETAEPEINKAILDLVEKARVPDGLVLPPQ